MAKMRAIQVGAPGAPFEFVQRDIPEPGPGSVRVTTLIGTRATVRGWPSGTSIDSQDTMAFSMLTGVRPMIETFPLERAADAYDRMMSGRATFRVVLITGL
jgi:D-arabinose 1-dehydrogenase-like Zn-dependent alcohol dehydrogenase